MSLPSWTYRTLGSAPVLFAAAASTFATTWTIRPDGTGDFPTIEAGVAAATDGDVLELADGTYHPINADGIRFLGKAITIRSAGGDPAVCIVQGGLLRRCFLFDAGEGQDSRLEAVTATGMWGRVGAISCEGASPTLERCVIADNTDAGGPLPFTGHGINLVSASPRITDCIIRNNDEGAGIWCDTSSPVITGTVLAVNWWGVVSYNGSAPTLESCTLGYNWHGAVVLGAASLDRCIVAFNGESIAADPVTLSCCDLYGNALGDWVGSVAGQEGLAGNFSADPLFCAIRTDLSLKSDSPCLPPGPTGCGLIGALGAGCDPTSIRADTWARTKNAYR